MRQNEKNRHKNRPCKQAFSKSRSGIMRDVAKGVPALGASKAFSKFQLKRDSGNRGTRTVTRHADSASTL